MKTISPLRTSVGNYYSNLSIILALIFNNWYCAKEIQVITNKKYIRYIMFIGFIYIYIYIYIYISTDYHNPISVKFSTGSCSSLAGKIFYHLWVGERERGGREREGESVCV